MITFTPVKPGDRDASMYSRIFPLRAEPERLSASRPCLFGIAQLRHGARSAAGGLLLRIEDIDATRCRPEYEAAIYEDLRWLGISWERAGAAAERAFRRLRGGARQARSAGPDLSELREPRARSPRWSRSATAQGGWPRDPDGVPLYPGARATDARPPNARAGAEAGEPYALRLAMDAAVARAGVLTWTETGAGPHGQSGLVAAAPQMWGDVVLARKEMPTSYHLAVVVDDALQGVTDVVRGQDLFWSTSIHRLLQALLGLPEPSLSPSPAHSRRRRPQAVEIDAGHGLARIARGRRERRATSGAWSGSDARIPLSHGISRRRMPPLVLFCRPAAVPWCGGRGSHGADQRPNRGPARSPRRKKRRSARAKAWSRAPAAGRRDQRGGARGLRARYPHALTGILALGELLASSNLGERERRWAARHQEQRRASRRADDFGHRCRQGRRRCADVAAGGFSAAPRSSRRWRQSLAARAETKGLTRRGDDRRRPAGAVVGDPVRLRAALENLIDNAVKFTEHGAVRLDVRGRAPAERGRVNSVFTVTDSGIGLTRAEIKRLFRPFAQASAEIARRYGGAGLGLAFVKRWPS